MQAGFAALDKMSGQKKLRERSHVVSVGGADTKQVN